MKVAAAFLTVAIFATPAFAEYIMPPIPLHPRRMDPDLSRSQVRAIQEKLGSMGYEVGSPDGVIGPETREGVEKFQSDHRLTATGDLTERTVAAIEAAKANTISAR